MSELQLPEMVASQLQGLSEPVHLCDASGKRLGSFVPAIDLSEYEVLGPDLSDQVADEISRSQEWFTTSQVLQRLESLR
jgi:hypothetical protein